MMDVAIENGGRFPAKPPATRHCVHAFEFEIAHAHIGQHSTRCTTASRTCVYATMCACGEHPTAKPAARCLLKPDTPLPAHATVRSLRPAHWYRRRHNARSRTTAQCLAHTTPRVHAAERAVQKGRCSDSGAVPCTTSRRRTVPPARRVTPVASTAASHRQRSSRRPRRGPRQRRQPQVPSRPTSPRGRRSSRRQQRRWRSTPRRRRPPRSRRPGRKRRRLVEVGTRQGGTNQWAARAATTRTHGTQRVGHLPAAPSSS